MQLVERINIKNIGNLTLIKIFGAILGIIYSITQVYYFGATREIEIYFAAQTTIGLVSSLIQHGKLGTIFLPIYIDLREKKGQLVAQQAFSVIINRIVFFTLIATITAFVLAPYLIDIMVPGFSPDYKKMTILLFRVLSLSLVLIVLNGMSALLLNAEKIFGKTELIGLLNTIISITILVFFYEKHQVWALVLASIFGVSTVLIFNLWLLRKTGINHYWIWKHPNFDHKSFFKAIYSTSLYVSTTQIYNIVLTASVSALPEGVYATFKYAQGFYVKTRGILVDPVRTVYFTSYSTLISQRDWETLKSQVKNATSYLILIGITTLIFTIILGETFIRFMWEGDKFGESAIQLAFWFLIFNYIGLLFSSIAGIFTNLAMSFDFGPRLYFLWSFSQLVSAILTYFLIFFFSTNGLLWIIPINIMLLGMIPFYQIYKTKKYLIVFDRKTIYRLLILAVIIIPCGIFIHNYFQLIFTFFTANRLNYLCQLAATTLSILLIALPIAYLLEIKEIRWLFKTIKLKVLLRT